MTQALARPNGGSSALAIVDENLQRQAEFLKMTLPYGKNLTDANAIALVAYCNTFGLNAQNGEAYFLVQVSNGQRRELGLYPGIKAWRKKAKEQLREVDKLANYKVDYEQVDPSELGVSQNDRGKYILCVRARLSDDVSRSKYLSQLTQLLAAGLKIAEIESIIGKPPFWYGYGSVRASELPYLKMEPIRVAEKRAEKDATSRRFDLPFSDDALADDVDPGLVFDIEHTEKSHKSYRSIGENMRAIGYPSDDDPINAEYHEELEDNGDSENVKPWTNTAVSLETAMNEKSSDGTPYWDMETSRLAVRANSLSKALAKNNLADDEKSERELKLAVIQAILDYRA